MKSIFAKSNIDINQQDDNGRTLLHIACKYQNYNIVKYLIGRRININAKDNKGLTALNEVEYHANDPVFKYLRENGALKKDQIGRRGKYITVYN